MYVITCINAGCNSLFKYKYLHYFKDICGYITGIGCINPKKAL